MVKALASDGSIILGLSKDNIDRLQRYQLIKFDGRPFGCAADVWILFGETELAIASALTSSGASSLS